MKGTEIQMMKETLKTISTAYGPAGNESRIAHIIREMVAPYADETRIDAMGNLIVTRRGKEGGKRIMLAAHMDHIGFVVTHIDEKGFARLHNVGGVSKTNSTFRRVVFENGVNGIVASEPEKPEAAMLPKNDHLLTDMYIDLGASSRAEAEALISVGDFAVYAPEFFELGSDMVAGTAMDNRAGCAILVETLKALGDTRNEVVAVFTVQEEVGLRGAQAAAYDVSPDIGIALDVTPAGDTPKESRFSVNMGAGIAVKIMDRSVICHPAVVRALENAARRCGAKYQREVLIAGGTDTAAIQRSRAGVPCGALSIPSRYIHSACEVVSLSDMENGVKLLTAFLSE